MNGLRLLLRERWLCALLVMGLMVRVPGVFWGSNFPGGWNGHHVDEYTHLGNAQLLINPARTSWDPQYPKGMAAHVAIPLLAWRVVTGQAFAGLPGPRLIITAGRAVAVLYGTATILLVFLLARKLFTDQRVAPIAALIFTLGGLHVTQSHFFLADVPSLFWLLLGLYVLHLELETAGKQDSHYLEWAAFCFGVSFGLKLMVAGLISLAVAALLVPPRLRRTVVVAIFFAAGVTAINFWTFSPYDLFKTVTHNAIRGAGLSRWASAGLYGIELPSVVSLPVFLLATAGAIGLTHRLLTAKRDSRFLRLMLVAVIPLAASLWLILFTIDHFPRHLIVLVPWISMATAWSLCRSGDYLSTKGLHPALVMTPVFLYLCVFVYDGERVFWNDPRNRAAEWLMRNVNRGESVWWWEQGFIPAALGYKYMRFPADGRPSIILVEMHYANHYLSGMGWRDSYPRDYRKIFMAQSQAQIDQLQSLFRGTSEYRERARFREGYFMPEYTVVDRLIGNRARNYVAEVVIFARATEANATGSAAPTPVR